MTTCPDCRDKLLRVACETCGRMPPLEERVSTSLATLEAAHAKLLKRLWLAELALLAQGSASEVDRKRIERLERAFVRFAETPLAGWDDDFVATLDAIRQDLAEIDRSQQTRRRRSKQ